MIRRSAFTVADSGLQRTTVLGVRDAVKSIEAKCDANSKDLSMSDFVHTKRYGTAQSAVEAALAHGKDMIFDVDWQGGQALSARWPDDSLKIFILPPDLTTLANRLRSRATDDPEVIQRRLENALGELEHFDEYPYLIVNDDLERAYAVLRAIYLTRKYGKVDRPDVPFPLTARSAK